jgi:cytochrome c biogenesis protein CcmG/thiol:disulfide interchange protein DsbE
MKAAARIVVLLFLAVSSALAADETFHTLKVKDQVYTNVTVTSSTATDIYFSHSRGLASAKLKDLEPAMQKHFHYDAAKSAGIESEQRQATADYKAALAKAKPEYTRGNGHDDKSAGEDFVAPAIHARSIRGQALNQIAVEKWLTNPPDARGKFALIDFWATWCGPCRQSIPELNAFAAKHKDKLVVIGISDESEDVIHKMTTPHINYAVASDTQQRMLRTLQITAIPHCVLVDPSGIVRYEGNPMYLDDAKLQHFLDKYSN